VVFLQYFIPVVTFLMLNLLDLVGFISDVFDICKIYRTPYEDTTSVVSACIAIWPGMRGGDLPPSISLPPGHLTRVSDLTYVSRSHAEHRARLSRGDGQ